MSTPAAVIRARVLTDATAIQSNYLGPAPSRFYHLSVPQNVPRPYIVYGIVGGSPAHHLTGAGGLWQGRVLVEGYTDTVDAAEVLAEIVRTTCDGYRGEVAINATVYNVRRLHIVSESFDVDYIDEAKPKPVYRFSKELELDVFQSIPSY